MELTVTLTLLQVRTTGAVGGWRPGPATATTHLTLSRCLDTSSAFLRGLAPRTPISQMANEGQRGEQHRDGPTSHLKPETPNLTCFL